MGEECSRTDGVSRLLAELVSAPPPPDHAPPLDHERECPRPYGATSWRGMRGRRVLQNQFRCRNRKNGSVLPGRWQNGVKVLGCRGVRGITRPLAASAPLQLLFGGSDCD